MSFIDIPVEALKAVVGEDQILTDPVDLIPYGFDGTAALKKTAVCVVFPRTTEQVAELVKLAGQYQCPIVTRGSGSGLSGGSVPVTKGLILCLVKMDRILEVDAANLTLRAEAGAITREIADAAEKVGLFYPPDPGSMKISTIGGNVAENSGGLRGLKYGVTRNYVMGLKVVLASGEIVELGNKCVKDVAGYSMKDVFVGSEGTLGIVTEVLLRLVPKPEARKTLLATYADMESAARTVSAIIANKIIPCTLEFLDRVTIACVEDYAHIGLPLDAEAILLMETDGHPAVVDEEARKMSEIAMREGATEVTTAANAVEADRLASARRTAFSALARRKPTTILEDATVPRSELAPMVKRIQEIGQRYNLEIGTFGHMGDGNLHPTFLTDERNHEEMERVEAAMVEIFDFAIGVGGTITGEHGVGLAKKPFLGRQFPEGSMNLLKALKKAWDPAGILNPGKIFDV